MRHLASTEKDRDLAAVPVLDEAADVLDLGQQVVVVGVRPEFDFLDLDLGLALLGFLGLLLFLVEILAVVHDLADRRLGVGRHLDQVKTQLFGTFQGLGHAHDAQLVPVISYNPDFLGPDLLVPAGLSS
ncbi:hypothetical protein DSECCO2_482370 [anaerobic digester metagenome]